MNLPSGWIARPKVDHKGINVTLEMSELILCKDCKHYETDSMAMIDGIPIIVAHSICNKWGGGCKTEPNGYCYLAEKTEGENE